MDAGTVLVLLIAWLFFAIVAGTIASEKGHSFHTYFLLGFFLSPLVGLAAALLVAPTESARAAAGGLRKCPRCAEFVKPEAKVCRFCRGDLAVEE